MPLDQAEATRQVNAMMGKAAYPAPTTPMMVRLMTAMGSPTSNGTEVANSGGSAYAPQNGSAATPAGAAAGALSNTVGALAYTNMPTINSPGVVGLEIWDSNGTPRRACYGTLTAAKTTALGDSLVIPSSSLNIAQV